MAVKEMTASMTAAATTAMTRCVRKDDLECPDNLSENLYLPSRAPRLCVYVCVCVKSARG